MHYINIEHLPEGYDVVKNRTEEFVRDPDGTLFRFVRKEGSSIVCIEADYVDGNTPYKGWNCFYSESGEFVCDQKGRLRKFISSDDNALSIAGCQGILKHLVIPEGVRQIGAVGFLPSADERPVIGFRSLIILDRICFPDSLKVIGFDCFSDCCLPEVTFPVSLEKMDAYAFCCRIRRLIIPSNMKRVVVSYAGVMDADQNPPEDALWIVGRDFRRARIDELVCPEDFLTHLLMPEAIIGKRENLTNAQKEI